MNYVFGIAAGVIIFAFGVSLATVLGGMYFRVQDRFNGDNILWLAAWMFFAIAVLVPICIGGAVLGVHVGSLIIGAA